MKTPLGTQAELAVLTYLYVATLVGSCAAGWHLYSDTDSCFYTSTTQLDMPTARSECQKMDADLASIRSDAEMQFVVNIS